MIANLQMSLRQVPILRHVGCGLVVLISCLSGCAPSAPQPVVVLVYELDMPEDTSEAKLKSLTESAVRTLETRLSLTDNVTMTRPGLVEVRILPPFDQSKLPQMRQRLEQYGTLEFHVTANRRDHADVIALAENVPAKGAGSQDVLNEDGELMARWSPVRVIGEEDHFEPREYVVRGGEADDEGPKQILLIVHSQDPSGEHVERASVSLDAQARPMVFLNLNKAGALRMELLTRANQPSDDFRRHLAIVFDGRVYSAPSINAVIGGDIVIEGDFEQDEVNTIVKLLESGALPCRLKLIEERLASP